MNFEPMLEGAGNESQIDIIRVFHYIKITFKKELLVEYTSESS